MGRPRTDLWANKMGKGVSFSVSALWDDVAEHYPIVPDVLLPIGFLAASTLGQSDLSGSMFFEYEIFCQVSPVTYGPTPQVYVAQ